MKERRITALIIAFFSPRQAAPARKTREVPVLTDRELAFHRGTHGVFTLDRAVSLYRKIKPR